LSNLYWYKKLFYMLQVVSEQGEQTLKINFEFTSLLIAIIVFQCSRGTRQSVS
jgi:hypothetical protein